MCSMLRKANLLGRRWAFVASFDPKAGGVCAVVWDGVKGVRVHRRDNDAFNLAIEEKMQAEPLAIGAMVPFCRSGSRKGCIRQEACRMHVVAYHRLDPEV